MLKWTLETIRKDGSYFSWMEERRLEWVPLVVSKLELLLEGKTFIVLTDANRDWLCSYILNTINKKTNERPYLPFVSLKSFFPSLQSVKTNEDMELLEDMLSIAFPNGYIFFYIGQSNHLSSQIAKKRDDSLMWIMDEHIQNSFYLNSKDKHLDIKLIQLCGLLDKTIDALLYAEVSSEDE